MKIFFKCFLIFFLFANISLKKNTIFLIPHTHDDLGWKRTIDEYYNETVKSIFDTTIESLLRNKSRKFVYADIGFLKIYLESDPNSKMEKVNKINQLIISRQWEFLNGGMSQADTACSHYEDLIENIYYGLLYLKINFNSNSKSGWQIDPFGHSKTFSYLLALFGLKDLVINRIGDDLKKEMGRFDKKNLTFNWIFPDGRKMRTHVATNEYDPPKGMDCDIRIEKVCDFEKFKRLETDFFLAEFNMKYTFSPWYVFGDDFYFADAENNFSFADKVIGIYDTMKYALFSDYVKDVEEQMKAKSTELMEFKDDFLVYTQEDGSTWSGFYTTKPSLKLKIRNLGKLMRIFKHFIIQYLVKNKINAISSIAIYLDILQDFGYFLHHDTITGTSLRRVDADYYLRLENLIKRIYSEINKLNKSQFLFCDENDDLLRNNDCSFKDTSKKSIFYTIFNPSGLYYKEKTIEFVFLSKINPRDLLVQNEAGVAMKLGRWGCYVNRCKYFFIDEFKPFESKTYKINFSPKQKIKKIDEDSNNKNPVLDLKRKIPKSTKKIEIDMKESELNNLAQLSNFENYYIILEDNRIIIQKKGSNQVINAISFWKIKSGLSNHYILNYQGPPQLQKVEFNSNHSISFQKMNGYNLFYLSTKDWIFHIKNKINNPEVLTLTFVFINIQIFEESIDFLMKVENPNIINNEIIETDSNGYFSMKRKNKKKFEESVFPFTSYVKIKNTDSEASTTIFNDRAQGVINDAQGSLLVYLQRSTSQNDIGESLEVKDPFSVKFKLLNVDSEKEWNSKYPEIINLMDIDFFQSFHEIDQKFDFIEKVTRKGKKGTNQRADNLSEDSGLIDNLRLNIDFFNNKKFIIRIQNLNKQDIVSVSSRDFLQRFFGELIFKEISFDYLFSFDPEKPKMVEEIVSLNPLEFKTYLAEFN